MRCGKPLVIALSIGNSPSLTPRARFPWQLYEWVMALESTAAPMSLYFDRVPKSMHVPEVRRCGLNSAPRHTHPVRTRLLTRHSSGKYSRLEIG